MGKQIMLILAIMLAGASGPLQAMEQPERNTGFDYEKWERAKIRNNSEQLLKAIKSGNFQEAETLILVGLIDVNVKDKVPFTLGNTPLISAVRARSPKLVRLLIAEGADVNAAGSDGGTALLFAAGLGQQEITEMLIAAGTDVNKVYDDGKTSLFWAVKNGHKEIALALLDAMLKLTKEQKDSVYALIASLERTPSLQTSKDTRRLIAQALIDTYKKENLAKTRAEIEKIENGELRNQLLQLLEGK